MNRAAFFDRDGTIIVDSGYPSDPSTIVIISRTAELIREYNRKKWCVICITNQSGVARGYCTEGMVEQFNAALNNKLNMEYSCNIDSFYYCPHHPSITGECNCRKPQPGMFIKAARDYDIDLGKSVSYGDSERDRIASLAAGIREFYFIR